MKSHLHEIPSKQGYKRPATVKPVVKVTSLKTTCSEWTHTLLIHLGDGGLHLVLTEYKERYGGLEVDKITDHNINTLLQNLIDSAIHY